MPVLPRFHQFQNAFCYGDPALHPPPPSSRSSSPSVGSHLGGLREGHSAWQHDLYPSLSRELQRLSSQLLDMADSKGMLTVKLLKELTIAGAFHGSHKQRVKILETRIPQQYLDSLEHGEAGVGQHGEEEGEGPFWALRASEGEVSWLVQPLMPLPNTPRARSSLRPALLFPFQEVLPGSASRKPSETPNSLTSRYPPG